MLPLRNRSLRPLVGPALALLVVLGLARVARADQVDRLMTQLRSASDYKVRLSAALNLAKIGDQRAVPALVGALRDRDKTVRGVAAAGLGKLVNPSTSESMRRRALDQLKVAAARDGNSFVRKQAQKAYDLIRKLDTGGSGGGSGGSGGTYVNIGSMSAKTANASAIRALMRQTVASTFHSRASSMMTAWPGGKGPTAAQIKARGLHAFHVDGTVNEVKSEGGTVECKVSMLLATYPDKSMFGFLKGGARVEAGGDDVEGAAEDCVRAVVEDMTARKIIPTIEARTP